MGIRTDLDRLPDEATELVRSVGGAGQPPLEPGLEQRVPEHRWAALVSGSQVRCLDLEHGVEHSAAGVGQDPWTGDYSMVSQPGAMVLQQAHGLMHPPLQRPAAVAHDDCAWAKPAVVILFDVEEAPLALLNELLPVLEPGINLGAGEPRLPGGLPGLD
jgi:hypothetical protein